MRIRHQHWAQALRDGAPDFFAALEPPQIPEPTYTGALDGERLTTLLHRVVAALAPGLWLTLGELKERCGGSEAGISARIREARTRAGGSHVIERRRRGNPKQGLWEYRRVK